MKRHLLLCCLIGIMSILGYFYFQRKIIFIDHPTIEINSPFYYKKYIKKVKNGSINDVTYSAKDLNNQTLGHYTVTYFFKGKTYHLKIEVIDTKKPTIKESESLKIEKGKSYDLKKGIIIKDNSNQYNLTIDTNDFNPNQIGNYTIYYKANDLSNNQTTFKRKVTVVKKIEIGTHIESNKKIVYLTFDDGPSQNTDRILKILKKYNAKATFFVTGCHQEYNQYIIEAYKQGHTIGLHSYLHEYQDIYSSKDAYFKDLKKIKQMVKQLIGIQVHYIRFPGGRSNRISKNYCHGIMSQLTREVIKQGYQYYDWNGDTTDASGDHIPTATIIKQATSETHQNIVLLAHDTDAKDTTVAALPSIIQYYKEKGYQFLGIDDESYYVHHDIQN